MRITETYLRFLFALFPSCHCIIANNAIGIVTSIIDNNYCQWHYHCHWHSHKHYAIAN